MPSLQLDEVGIIMPHLWMIKSKALSIWDNKEVKNNTHKMIKKSLVFLFKFHKDSIVMIKKIK